MVRRLLSSSTRISGRFQMSMLSDAALSINVEGDRSLSGLNFTVLATTYSMLTAFSMAPRSCCISAITGEEVQSGFQSRRHVPDNDPLETQVTDVPINAFDHECGGSYADTSSRSRHGGTKAVRPKRYVSRVKNVAMFSSLDTRLFDRSMLITVAGE